MRSFALFLLISIVAGTVMAHAAVSLAGSWAGEMRQVDADREARYPMTLTLKGKTGTTVYPALKCAGTLAMIGDARDGVVVYQETIKNEAGGTCIDGLMMVSEDAGKLMLGWYSVAGGPGKQTLASAVLSRAAKN